MCINLASFLIDTQECTNFYSLLHFLVFLTVSGYSALYCIFIPWTKLAFKTMHHQHHQDDLKEKWSHYDTNSSINKIIYDIYIRCLGQEVHTFNPSTQEAETGRSLWVQGQRGLWELVPGQIPKLQKNLVSKHTQNKQTNKKKQPTKQTNKQK